MIISVTAIVISVLAILINAWTANQSRMINQWCRSRFAGPMPKWWQIRWRPTAPPMYEPVIHVQGVLTQERSAELREWFKRHIRTQPPGGAAGA